MLKKTLNSTIYYLNTSSSHEVFLANRVLIGTNLDLNVSWIIKIQHFPFPIILHLCQILDVERQPIRTGLHWLAYVADSRLPV